MNLADGSLALRASDHARFCQGYGLTVSPIASGDRVLPLTVDKQLVSVEAGFEYRGGIVPYRSDREEEILKAAKMAARALDLSGYAGIDLVVGDLPRVVDRQPPAHHLHRGDREGEPRGAAGLEPEGRSVTCSWMVDATRGLWL